VGRELQMDRTASLVSIGILTCVRDLLMLNKIVFKSILKFVYWAFASLPADDVTLMASHSVITRHGTLLV
jgi:hypothetical protein